MNENVHEYLLNEVDQIEKLKGEYKKLNTKVEQLTSKMLKFKFEYDTLVKESLDLKLEIDVLLNERQTSIKRIIYLSTTKVSPKFLIPESLLDLFKVESYVIGNYVFNTKERILYFKGEKESSLTAKESYLLVLFATNMNVVIERNFMLNSIWKGSTYKTSRSMDVYITKLRKLLEKDSNISIYNLHGKGYNFIVQKQ